MISKKILLLAVIAHLCVSSESLSRSPFDQISADGLKSCTLSDFMKYVVPGYPVEIHQVVSSDGFKLNLFRLQKKGTTIQKGLPPVLLQHGINDSGIAWIMNGEDASFAYLLANAGFDVYLGNNRGNRFSREHTTLDPKSKEFWQFSFQDMAERDIPAFFTAIRGMSGVDKITYVGHSQGTSQMFAALSDPAVRPSVAPFLESFHAFAPVVYLTNTDIMGMQLAKLFEFILNPLLNTIHLNHLGLGTCKFDPNLVTKIEKECSQKQCDFAKQTDPYPDTLNYLTYGLFENASPAGYSMQCIVHFAQLIKENRKSPVFKKYDYGSAAENKKYYGQEKPPVYDLSNIREKVTLYLGEADRLADIKDTRNIAGHLPNAQVQVVSKPRWGHMAFTLAKDGRAFYSSIIAQLKSSLKMK